MRIHSKHDAFWPAPEVEAPPSQLQAPCWARVTRRVLPPGVPQRKSAFFWWRTASQKDAEKYRKYLKNPHRVVAKSSLSIPLVSLYILVVAFLIFLAASRYIALIWNCMGQSYWKDYPAFASGCSPPHPPDHSSHSRCTPFQCLGPDETGRPFSFPIPGLCNPKCLCKLQPPFWSANRLSPTPERTPHSKHLSNLPSRLTCQGASGATLTNPTMLQQCLMPVCFKFGCCQNGCSKSTRIKHHSDQKRGGAPVWWKTDF